MHKIAKRLSFEDAKAQYVHRFTMEHVPNWALEERANGLYYAPQFRTDREWYEATKFPGEEGGPPRRAEHCETQGQTWPLGKFLSAPYRRTDEPA